MDTTVSKFSGPCRPEPAQANRPGISRKVITPSSLTISYPSNNLRKGKMIQFLKHQFLEFLPIKNVIPVWNYKSLLEKLFVFGTDARTV
jgi:hypothetical protein